MDNRNKDELAEKNRKLQEEVKNMPDLPSDDKPPAPGADPDPGDDDKPFNPEEDKPDTGDEGDDPDPEPLPLPENPPPAPAPAPEKKEDPKPAPSPEELLKQQKREGIILHKKNEQFVDTVEEASKVTVTDEEIKAEFPNYDEMTTGEQILAKRSLISDKRFRMIHETVQKDKKVNEWGEKVDLYLADEKNHLAYPGLNGRDEEFKRFCLKEQHRNIDLDLLAKSFLFDFKPPKQPKGSLFNTGSDGGHDPEPKKEELTPEMVKWYREHQPRHYAKLVREKKINIEI